MTSKEALLILNPDSDLMEIIDFLKKYQIRKGIKEWDEAVSNAFLEAQEAGSKALKMVIDLDDDLK